MDKTWYSAKGRADGTADIAIFNDIGDFGVTAGDFYESLRALGNPSEIRISISSDGGDVSHGFAIYNMLKRHPANKVVTIEGLAASMASVIAMAGDEVVMPSNAMIMIHNPWGAVMGESDQIISFGEALDKMRKAVIKSYIDRTGIAKDEIIAMMDKETWLDAKESVKLGFADRIEKPVKMAAHFNTEKFRNVPESFGRSVRESQMTTKTKGKTEGETEEQEGTGVVQTADEIRKELLATQKEIRSLCKLAGKPDLADKFIEDDKTPAEVLAALDAAREQDALKGKDKSKGKSEVSARHSVTESGNPAVVDQDKIYARWNSAGRNAA